MQIQKHILSLLLALLCTLSVLSIPSFADVKDKGFIEDVVNAAIEIICRSEGTYKTVYRNDNGAVSVGKIQWHATDALLLVQDIVKANPEKAQTLLTQELYEEITDSSSSWENRILTKDEASVLSSFLDTEESKKVQDEWAYNYVYKYAQHAYRFGVTDPYSVVFLCDVENKGGSLISYYWMNAAADYAGSFADIDIDDLLQVGADRNGGTPLVRFQRVYKYLTTELDLGDINPTGSETWKVSRSDTLTYRDGPGKDYSALGKYNKGDIVTVTERYEGDDYIWAKTDKGWVALYYMDYMYGRTELPEDSEPPKISDIKTRITAYNTCNLTFNVSDRSGIAEIYTETTNSFTGKTVKSACAVKDGGVSVVIDLDTVNSSSVKYTVKITAKDKKGFTKSVSVTINSPYASNTVYTVDTSVLNIREYPDENSTKVGTYTANTSVTVYYIFNGTDYTWGNTDKGWIALDYCKRDTTSDTECPVISRFTSTDFDWTGYWVHCHVTDNVGVVKAEFSTDFNGTTVKETVSADPDGIIDCFISAENCDYTPGTYTTYVTVYDANGNTSSAKVRGIVNEKPADIKGDINGDKVITLADAMLTFRHVAKTETITNTEPADINNDGLITLADAMAIFRFVAKITNTVEI